MSLARTIVSDRTGLLGAGAGVFVGLPPAAVYGYLLVRLLIPVLLIVHATHGATPAQRIGLVRDYLIGAPGRPGAEPDGPGVDRAPCRASSS
jgi:hypothetical protein